MSLEMESARTCFVCDGSVAGNRYYTLASCKTQLSKQRLVDKLGQLVGEQYMVVISEDDIICRSCHTMLNTMDRLERELSSVRAVLLRFLERKYELEEGELSTDAVVTLPPPPELPAAIAAAFKKEEEPQPPLTFHERKRRSESMLKSSDNKSEPPSKIWMQCDKCRYTTPYTSFMIHHIHKHAEPKAPPRPPPTPPPKAKPQVQVSGQFGQEVVGDGEVEEEGLGEEEVEGGAAVEVNEPLTNGVAEPHTKEEEETEVDQHQGHHFINGDDHQAMEMAGGVEGEGVVEGGEGGDVVEMDLSDGNLCMVDENGVAHKVRQGEDGQYYLVEEDEEEGGVEAVGGEEGGGEGSNSQLISVEDDSSVRMVQMVWNEDGSDAF